MIVLGVVSLGDVILVSHQFDSQFAALTFYGMKRNEISISRNDKEHFKPNVGIQGEVMPMDQTLHLYHIFLYLD